jgi:fluoroquinolone resistance protein
MKSQIERLRSNDSFTDAVFEGDDLEAADLGNKELYGCTFRGLNLQQTRWDGSRLEDCVFQGCDLTRMLPARLSLRGVQFKDCKLMGIDWTHVAPHPDVSFSQCNLRYSSFVDASMRKTEFRQTIMDEANWIQVDLGESRFEECRFSGTRFEGCNLERAKFPGCIDLILDPSKNRVKGASVPLQSAVLLASSFGMRVLGFSEGTDSE